MRRPKGAHTHIHIHKHTHIGIHKHTHKHTHTHTHTRTDTHTRTHTYTHIHKHTLTHTYTLTQRSHHIARLAARNDPRAKSPDALIFSSNDMIEVMNTWRQQPETWMDSATLKKVTDIKWQQQHYHQACKNRFSTMLFQLFGNKSLAEILIRIPIMSKHQPASVLKKFAFAWRNYKDGPQARLAREISPKQVAPRLSKQIYQLQKRIDRGRWIAEWVAEDWNNWYLLTAAEKQIWSEYNSGDIQHKIADLREEQQPNFFLVPLNA